MWTVSIRCHRALTSAVLLVSCSAALKTLAAQTLIIPPYSAPPSYEVPSYGLPSDLPREDQRQSPQYSPPLAGDFSITVRTDILSPFVNRQQVESDNVATRVMEADVRGMQTTTTSVQLQSIAGSTQARFNIQTSGTVSSNTIGYTPQAQVSTLGNHTFNVTKPVYFDGNRFLTKSAYGSLQARQTPQAIHTVGGGLPLIGRIGQRIAWNEVYRRMPVSDSIVVRRVADDVVPKVNSSVDRHLVDLNRNWRRLRQQIGTVVGQDQLEWSASSTGRSFSTTAVNRSIGSRSPEYQRQLLSELADREAAAIVCSQDGLNHLIDKVPLAGLTVSDTSLQKMMLVIREAKDQPQQILDLYRSPPDLSAEPLLFSVRMADHQPLRFVVKDGLFAVHLRFQILPKAGAAAQMMLMKVRIGGDSGANGTWALTVKDVTAEPASHNEQPDTWTKMIATQAPQLIRNLPATELSRRIDLRSYHDRLPVLRVHRIQADNGQLRISLNQDETPGQVTTQRPRIYRPGP